MNCPPRGLRVALLGDSFAEGLAPELGRLANLCGAQLSASTASGSGGGYWGAERVKRATRGASVVLISLGLNDFEGDPGSADAGARRIAAQLERAGKRALWISPPAVPVPDRAGARAAWSRAVPEHVKWEKIIDLPRGADGIHPTPASYRKWAKAIWDWTAAITRGQAKPAVLPSAAIAVAALAISHAGATGKLGKL